MNSNNVNDHMIRAMMVLLLVMLAFATIVFVTSPARAAADDLLIEMFERDTAIMEETSAIILEATRLMDAGTYDPIYAQEMAAININHLQWLLEQPVRDKCEKAAQQMLIDQRYVFMMPMISTVLDDTMLTGTATDLEFWYDQLDALDIDKAHKALDKPCGW